MGAVMQSIWIKYSCLVCDDWLWTEENRIKSNDFAKQFGLWKTLPREYNLAEMEEAGGEDESFREHVKQHIEKFKDDDPYWNFDKRIGTWINKVFESRIPKMDEAITCNCGNQKWVLGTSGVRCASCQYWVPKGWITYVVQEVNEVFTCKEEIGGKMRKLAIILVLLCGCNRETRITGDHKLELGGLLIPIIFVNSNIKDVSILLLGKGSFLRSPIKVIVNIAGKEVNRI